MRTYLLTFGVALLLVLAGCQGFTSEITSETEAGAETETQTVFSEEEHLGWSLSLTHWNAKPKPGGEFNSYVSIAGQFSGGEVSGVTVQFIAENGTVVSEIPVGTMTSLGKEHWVNTTVPMVPVYVVPKVEDWETPDTEFLGVDGTYITAGGEFQYYELDAANATK